MKVLTQKRYKVENRLYGFDFMLQKKERKISDPPGINSHTLHNHILLTNMGSGSLLIMK